MSEAVLVKCFPRLRNSGYRVTSPIDPSYNCIAYAASDQSRWWDPNHPDGYWPDGVERDDTVQGFIALFRSLGFELCEDGPPEYGFERVAIYGLPSGAFTHVARQLPSGEWTSKLGELEDITHPALADLDSNGYGTTAVILRRKVG